MKTTKCRVITGLVVTCLLFPVWGCGVTVVQATHTAYNHVRGDLVGIVPYQIDEVLPAVVTVIKRIDGYDLASQQSDFLNAQVLAYDDASRQVKIDLSRTENNQTKLQIRIGLIGDKLKSSMIFNRIIDRLSEQQALQNFRRKEQKGDIS